MFRVWVEEAILKYWLKVNSSLFEQEWHILTSIPKIAYCQNVIPLPLSFLAFFQFCMIWLIGCSAGAEQENLTFAIFLLPSCHRHLLPLQSTYCNLLPSSCDCCTFLARCHPPQPQITSWLPFSTTCWSWKKISKYEGLALIWQQLQHLLSAVLLKRDEKQNSMHSQFSSAANISTNLTNDVSFGLNAAVQRSEWLACLSCMYCFEHQL